PSRLNGLCGQLKCCTAYENEVYTHKRKLLPPEGKFIKTKNGDQGKVTKLHVIQEQFDMLTLEGKFRRYSVEQFDERECEVDENFIWPERFDHIVNETSTVIGLAKAEVSADEDFYLPFKKEVNRPELEE